jgi:hypothetical protein
MSSTWRRYEVLLPLEFNDGRPVPPEWLAEAVLQIVDRDNLVRLVVDVADSLENRQWMKQFKEQWKARLEQLDLWLVSYSIDVE